MIRLDKPHFGHIWGLFRAKTSNQDFPKKKKLKSVLTYYANVTLYKKIRKFLRVNFSKNLKNFIVGSSWHLWSKNLKSRVYRKQVLRLNLALTSCQKSKNATSWFFIKLEKLTFKPILGPFGLKPKQFWLCHFFKLNNLTL